MRNCPKCGLELLAFEAKYCIGCNMLRLEELLEARDQEDREAKDRQDY